MLKWFKKLSGEGEVSLPSFRPENVVGDTQSTTRDQALKFIADQMASAGYVKDAQAFHKDLIAREEHDSTGFKDQIATPHAKSKQVINAGIWVVQFSHDIPWETMDDSPVRAVVALAIPANSDESVMLPLIAISKANMKAEFRSILKEGDKSAVTTAIEGVIGGLV